MAFISCGKFDKKLLLICLITNLIIIINSSLSYFIDIFADKENGDTKNENIKYFLFAYFGRSLGIFFELIRKKNAENKNISLSNIKEKKMINYIFGDKSNNKITIKDKIFIILISFLILINDYIYIFIDILGKNNKNNDFVFLKFFFLFIVSFYIFKINYYQHHKISISIIILLGIFKLTINLILQLNNSGFIDLLKLIALYILNSFFYSIYIGYFKGLMEYKYFSPYKVTFIFGFTNFLLELLYISLFHIFHVKKILFAL